MQYVLPTIPHGSRRPFFELQWLHDDDTPENFAGGATLSGTITDVRTGASRAITGDLLIIDENNAKFEWRFSLADVVRGSYRVEFQADFEGNPTPARTFPARWVVS